MVKAISEVTGFDEKDDVKLSVLFYDGVTCLQGMAFNKAAKRMKQIFENGVEVLLTNYGVKSADQTFTRTKFEIRLYYQTTIQKCIDTQIESVEEHRFNVKQLHSRSMEKMFASSFPVIITAIGGIEKQEKRYLREIYVKDKTGKIKVCFWSNTKVDFEYEFGDILQFKYMFIDVFQNEMFMQRRDLSVIEKCNDYDLQNSMKKLLDGEDHDELAYKHLSLADVQRLRSSRTKIIIASAVLTKFAKEEDMIYMQCIVRGHGPLLCKSKKGGKYYCNDCKKNYVTGEKVTRLKAQFDDGSSSVWVTLYTASARLILADDFHFFHKLNIKKEECFSVLRQIEKERRRYKLFVSVRPFDDVDGELNHNVTVRRLRECDI